MRRANASSSSNRKRRCTGCTDSASPRARSRGRTDRRSARRNSSRRSSVTCGRPEPWHVSRAASTASGEQQARSVSRCLGIDPQAQGHAERAAARAQQCDRAVDPAAHRDGYPRGARSGSKHGPERVAQRVDGERLAVHGRRLEHRQPGEVFRRARGVRRDDALPVAHAVARRPTRRCGRRRRRAPAWAQASPRRRVRGEPPSRRLSARSCHPRTGRRRHRPTRGARRSPCASR